MKLVINAGMTSHGAVIMVDDEDITKKLNVQSVELRLSAGQTHEAVLYCRPDSIEVALEMTGVEVRHDDVAYWLDAVDPKELEDACMRQMKGFGGPTSTGQAMLLALQEMLS